MQIRQKLPGQTGYDPTFPLLPESVRAPVSLTQRLKCIFLLMIGVWGEAILASR